MSASFVPFSVGMRVEKVNGYPFEGTVQAVFTNRAGEWRVVVEMNRGFDGDILHIFSPSQLTESLILEDHEHRLEALGLPTRIHNLLVDAGYETVEQVQRERRKVEDIKGFGYTASTILSAVLHDWKCNR